jgi:hypothetical protein
MFRIRVSITDNRRPNASLHDAPQPKMWKAIALAFELGKKPLLSLGFERPRCSPSGALLVEDGH